MESKAKCLTLCLLMAGLLFSCNNSLTTVVESKIKISSTTGVMPDNESYSMGFYEKCVKLRRITNAERKALGIDEIEELKTNSNRAIAKGKEILKNENGRMETILVIWEEQAILEYLVSYDADGKVIDCITIGVHYYYDSDHTSAIIEGNTIRVLNFWCEPGDFCEDGIDQIYTISDDLHLIPFAWPAQSFPAEIPFMMHEADDSGYYYKIESVVCTRKSGNQYEFVLKGKTKQDCKNLKAAERTFMLVPLGIEAIPAGEPIKIVLPAVIENEKFEIKTKGLGKGKADETIFTWFRIQQ